MLRAGRIAGGVLFGILFTAVFYVVSVRPMLVLISAASPNVTENGLEVQDSGPQQPGQADSHSLNEVSGSLEPERRNSRQLERRESRRTTMSGSRKSKDLMRTGLGRVTENVVQRAKRLKCVIIFETPPSLFDFILFISKFAFCLSVPRPQTTVMLHNYDRLFESCVIYFRHKLKK